MGRDRKERRKSVVWVVKILREEAIWVMETQRTQWLGQFPSGRRSVLSPYRC